MHTLYTFGYTGLEPEVILVFALARDALIVDTRISPVSRHPKWNKYTLESVWGFNYVHIKALGNKNYKGEYGDGIQLLDADAGTMQAVKLLAKKPLMFMCACSDHATCHRSVASQEMQDRYGVEVVHLTYADFMPASKTTTPPPTQMSLF